MIARHIPNESLAGIGARGVSCCCVRKTAACCIQHYKMQLTPQLSK